MSAATAANDIWNDGPVAASGVISMIAAAANATPRAEMLTRSTSTARSARPIMAKARREETDAPDSSM